MTRAEKPLCRALAVLLAATAGYIATRSLTPRRGASGILGELRDAVNSQPEDLAAKHARLAPEGREACGLCHVPHKDAALPQAWTAAVGDEPTEATRPGLGTPATSVCLSCHDGSVAGRYAQAGVSLQNHPVGIDYRSVWLARPDEFNPPDGHPGIRLEDGRVGCISCHQLHGRSSPQARIGIIETACEACHRR